MSNYDTQLATPETATQTQIEQQQKQLHTALPAKVISFDSAKQTVQLAVQIKQLLADGKTIQIPPLADVPISYPRGGGFCVTFPLKAGDEGIAVFSERCIDGWWQSGRESEPLDYRLHDLSDALFIPGICSVPNAVSGFFTDGLSMQTLDGSTFIRITNGTILIQGNITHQGNTTQTGDLTQSGNLTSSGTVTGQTDVSFAGISGKGHVHSGVERGDKTSGVAQ